MSSSTDAGVLRGAEAHRAGIVPAPELRTGRWTRLGTGSVLGDDVTEGVLSALAESARAAAHAQGYATGWAEGRREAAELARQEAEQVQAAHRADDARRAAERSTAVAGLERAAQELTAAVARTCAAVEDRSAGFALAVTEQLVGRELALATDPGADAVRRALSLAGPGAYTVLHLHPDDVPPEGLPGSDVRVEADPTLSRGDAVLTGDDEVLDLRVEAALERLREVLR